jgi:hypothetical protein
MRQKAIFHPLKRPAKYHVFQLVSCSSRYIKNKIYVNKLRIIAELVQNITEYVTVLVIERREFTEYIELI